MTEHTRSHPACPDASNPFHQCAQYCVQKIAESGKISKDKKGSLSFGRRKKGSGSQPVSPQMNGNFPLHFVKKKAREQYGEPSSSRTPSGEISSRDSSFHKTTYESSQVVPISTNLKPDQPEVPSEIREISEANGFSTKQEVYKELHSSPTQQFKQTQKDAKDNRSPVRESLTSSVAVQAMEEMDDDADSSISETDDRVWFENIHVKSCVSSTLKAVFDKHGDIAAKCQLESLSLRAYYLESVCFVIQELQSTPFKYLTKSKVKEMLAILKDVESAQINVSWLRHVLDQVAEALDLIGQQRVAEITKANSDRDLEKTRKELELQMDVLAQKEKEVADARAKVAETKSRLNETEQKSTHLDEIILSLTSKV